MRNVQECFLSPFQYVYMCIYVGSVKKKTRRKNRIIITVLIMVFLTLVTEAINYAFIGFHFDVALQINSAISRSTFPLLS